MALLTDINSIDWGVSLAGSGNIVQGYDDINQCIDVILRTQKGTDPLRPFFGSNIYFYIDAPVNIAIPNIKREIIDALSLWEKRIEIVSITHILQESRIFFFITYKVVDDYEEYTTQLLLDNGQLIFTAAPPQSLILEAIIPISWPGFSLLLEFIVNGNPALPAPPAYGFASPQAMYTWVNNNWGSYARWYLTPYKLIAFVRPGMARTASLNITLSTIYRYAFTIPALPVGKQFEVQFNSSHPADAPPATLLPVYHTNMAAMLSWLNANWFVSQVTWVIENGVPTAGDFDAADFDVNDFNTSNFEYLLVAYTQHFDSFDIQVNIV